MEGFLAALQFLTILPCVKVTNNKGWVSSTMYFPIIGAFLGLILIGINKCLFILFPEPLPSLILVIILIILTGALHLDGLADTADAIFSGRDKEKMLAIMQDSHKGTFGVIGIITIILLKTSILSLIAVNLKNLGLFLMTLLSRYGMYLAITFFPYARPQGKAKIFFENRSLKMFGLSTLITLLLLGITLKWISIVILFLLIIFTLIISIAIKKMLGGLTGDTLGAICELNEIIVLLSIFIFSKFYI